MLTGFQINIIVKLDIACNNSLCVLLYSVLFLGEDV